MAFPTDTRTRLGLLSTVVLLSACASQAPAPTAPTTMTTPPPGPVAQVTSFAGVWRGEYRLTSCTGDRHCGPTIGTSSPFVLRLVQSGAQVEGVFDGSVTVDVGGIVDGDGVLRMSGTKAAAGRYDPTVIVRELAVRRADGALSGSIRHEAVYPAEIDRPSATIAISGTFADVRAVTDGTGDPDPRAITGTWEGMYVIRACTAEGWLSCYPKELGETASTRAVLTQEGNRVTGTVKIGPDVIPVSGTVGRTGFDLSGSTTFPVSGGRSVVELTRWSATRDQVGRLRGTFSFENRSESIDGTVRLTRYDADMISVVLKP